MEYPFVIDALGQMLNLPPASVIVLSCHFLSFPAAILFGRFHSSNLWFNRDNVSSLLGVITLVLSFQWDFFHLLLQWFLSYLIMKIFARKYIGVVTFTVIYSQVLLANIYKYFYYYGEYHLDYTGTLMLGTMRVSSLAFAVTDSEKNEEDLTPLQQKHVVRAKVSLREHFNYYFSFGGILFGPVVFYSDHQKFVNKQPTQQIDYKLALVRLLQGLAAVMVVVYMQPLYPPSLNYDDTVTASGLLYRHWIMFMTACVFKYRYYFVWLTSQSMCLFAGYDAGQETRELSTATVNPVKIELATSLKMFLDNWNIFAAKWLRYTCYERFGKFGLPVTFFLSALWHGFLPGYMISFLPLVLHAFVGRRLHKVVSPKFQERKCFSVFYSLITWLGTTILISFSGISFSNPQFRMIEKALSGFYWYPHILCFILMMVLPKTTPSANTDPTDSSFLLRPHRE